MEAYKKIQSFLEATLPPGIIGQKNVKIKSPSCKSLAKIKKPIKKMVGVELIMEDRSIYSGEGYVKNYNKTSYFIPNGKGTSILVNKDICIGTWCDGSLIEIGMYKSTEFEYIGEFYEGKFNGHGKMSFFDDGRKIVKIEGVWINNQINGMSTVEYNDESKYIGNVTNFIQHGKGIYYGHDGAVIDSFWTNGLLNGHANIKVNNMDITCRWVNGKICGNCHITYSDKSVYKGACDDKFKPTSFGVMIYSDASIYNGYWKDGLREGYGFCLYSNGDYYNGYWLKDKKHTLGIYFNKMASHAIEYCWENDNQKVVLRSYYY